MAQQLPLNDLHLELGGRMVEFAGWQCPLQYSGILDEHRHTRSHASLFDVSHMGQLQLRGEGVLEALERLSPSDLRGLEPMRQCYSLLLNERGGIEDDCMIGRADGFVWMVINASRAEHDMKLIEAVLPTDEPLQRWPNRALLALQGPAAHQVMAELNTQAVELPFMGLLQAELGGADCLIARSGYTGEDGFEISCQSEDAEALARLLLGQLDGAVQPAGLGARDSLRMEAGLCLYGQDLNPDITPAQARLGWVVGKNRRDPDGASANFAGARQVLAEMRDGPHRLRVGLKPEGARPVRPGAELTDPATGEPVGQVTSGGFAPSLNAPYAMGYVQAPFASSGQYLHADVRGHQVSLAVCPPAQIKRK